MTDRVETQMDLLSDTQNDISMMSKRGMAEEPSSDFLEAVFSGKPISNTDLEQANAQILLPLLQICVTEE